MFRTKIWAKDEPYIISFSENDSSAAMWSMYADGGKGIVLIIDNKNRVLMNIDDNYSTKPKPSKCHYCEKSTDLIDDNYIISLYGIFKIWMNDPNSHSITRPIDAYLGLPPTIKHKAFEYEKEHRFVLMNQELKYEVKHRTRNGVIVPYIEEKIPSFRVKGIIVGPTADFEQVKLSLQMFFKSKGGDLTRLCDEIYQSDIPFRG